jgi:hypothetical protein
MIAMEQLWEHEDRASFGLEEMRREFRERLYGKGGQMPEKSHAERYEAACHAMQTGVAHDLNLRPNSGTPKHLRVGVNVALRDHGSLVGLLISKGIITQEEYEKAIADGMEAEVKTYEDMIASQTGGATKITLH